MRGRRYRKIKKSSLKQIILSSAALLLILVLGLGITYSWIEGGTTYTILTENNGDVKTGANPYLNTTVKKNIKLDPSDNGATITLASYDHNANKDQELYFSPVLSANGSDFFFPTAFDSAQNAISYRKANTNDIGTKFINYKFILKFSIIKINFSSSCECLPMSCYSSWKDAIKYIYSSYYTFNNIDGISYSH